MEFCKKKLNSAHEQISWVLSSKIWWNFSKRCCSTSISYLAKLKVLLMLRVWRDGQKKQCYIYRMLAVGEFSCLFAHYRYKLFRTQKMKGFYYGTYWTFEQSIFFRNSISVATSNMLVYFIIVCMPCYPIPNHDWSKRFFLDT